MPLVGELREYICASFVGVWIETGEPTEAIVEIAASRPTVDAGDVRRRRRLTAGPHSEISAASADATAHDACEDLARGRPHRFPNRRRPKAALLVLENFHKFIASPEIVQPSPVWFNWFVVIFGRSWNCTAIWKNSS
jgi:hypothetical protein